VAPLYRMGCMPAVDDTMRVAWRSTYCKAQTELVVLSQGRPPGMSADKDSRGLAKEYRGSLCLRLGFGWLLRLTTRVL
jgi:hypothetical protein